MYGVRRRGAVRPRVRVIRLLSTLLLFASVCSGLLSVPVVRAQSCLSDQEPSETPETAMALSGAVCIQGTMEEKDQDLFLWTVSEDDATRFWSLTLTGVPETTTLVEVYRVESEPGKAPVQLGS